MLYVASRLSSTVQFADEQDTSLWSQLVPGFEPIERVNETMSIWKFWMTGEVFNTDNLQTGAFSLNKSEETDILQPAKLTIQSIASYLYIRQTDQHTIFTFLSPHQNALESLESLVASLYEPAVPVYLNKFLLTNQHDMSVRTVRFYDRKMGDEVQRTFAKPIQLNEAIRKYSSIVSPSIKRDLLSLTGISSASDLLLGNVSIDIDMQMNMISFSSEEMEMEAERKQIDYFFMLADRAFEGGL